MSLPTTPRERAGFRPCCDGTGPARTTPPFPSGFHPNGCHPPGQPSSARFAIPCGIRTFSSRPASVDALVFCPPASISSRVRFNAHAASTAKFNVISGPFPPFRARVRSLTLDAGLDEPLCITFGLKPGVDALPSRRFAWAGGASRILAVPQPSAYGASVSWILFYVELSRTCSPRRIFLRCHPRLCAWRRLSSGNAGGSPPSGRTTACRCTTLDSSSRTCDRASAH